jgi:hypothetical protein
VTRLPPLPGLPIWAALDGGWRVVSEIGSRPPESHGHEIGARLPRERDVEDQGVSRPSRRRLVPGEYAEFPRQEALRELRKVEGRCFAARSTPEVRRDTNHPAHIWLERVAAALRRAKVSVTVHGAVDIPVTET